MNTKESRRKTKGLFRFTGGGALLLAMIGLIIFSPLSASGRDALPASRDSEAAEAGGHHFGAVHAGPHRFGNGPGDGIEFFKIVLDLSDDQVKEIEPILAEHQEKIAELRGEGRTHNHRDMRMKRMHRSDRCDKVDRTEMRAKMRRQRRESEKDRERMRASMERNRDKLDKKLAQVLDDDQMEKYLKLRELREDRREQRRELREERRERRANRT